MSIRKNHPPQVYANTHGYLLYAGGESIYGHSFKVSIFLDLLGNEK